MPSKYESIIPSLPSYIPEDPQELAHQQRVDAIKLEIINDPEISKSPVSLAQEYADLRLAKDNLEEQLKAIQISLDAYAQMLLDSNSAGDSEWGQYGVLKTTMRLVSGDTIRVQHDPWARVFDKDANRKWAIKNGMERMLALPWQTINSITKECLIKAMPEPDGVKVWKKSKLVYTAAKEEK